MTCALHLPLPRPDPTSKLRPLTLVPAPRNSHTNKKICDEVAIIPSKRLRNKIAGFTTHLMKRIQKGPVRGISFKLQEEERERKDNFVPEVSALDTQGVPIDVDADTKDLLKSLGFDALPVNVVAPATNQDRPYRRNVVGLGRRD